MKYPGSRVPDRPQSAPTPFCANRTIQDPAAAFARLQKRADFLSARDGGFFEQGRYTRRNRRLGRAKIHFQGIQRSPVRNFLFISGGDELAGAAQLFVIQMNSRPSAGPWGTNLLFNSAPTELDKLVQMYDVTRDGLWHAGGLSVIGDVLAIPLENAKKSEIHFYDVSEPLELTRFRDCIERDAKATAVAICTLRDNRYLCAVWFKDGIDLYVSKTTDLRDGFPESPVRYRNLDDTRNYQSLNFLWNANHELFLIGTANTSAAAPACGSDRADLFRVNLDGFAAGVTEIDETLLQLLDTIKLKGGGSYHNFAAGGGIHVDERSQLQLYGVHHWRAKSSTNQEMEIRFAEFTESLDRDGTHVSMLRDGRVDLFERTNYGGRRLSIHGTLDAAIENYDRIRVRGERLSKISSVRFQLPEGSRYRLYSKSGFESDEQSPMFDLEGTTRVVSIPELVREWPYDSVRSSQFIDDSDGLPAGTSRSEVTIFES